ncbi:hypothetical protein JZO66_03955 [Enterococcus sp. DIV0242_7C1]|uniref:DUF6980 domain-containing protein n=1 Tax=Candidatus Enterococcus dunnyi TaxID=1834192 RepID=A0A200JEE8_9ENTE|nr:MULTISPECIES: hypothetical protein [unclassified Enterococcus]MBO0469688.1 hypothetical protein [Enterococcus sp. DIV0242_7C1]OUZ35015.1 hypothetical protein A5889_000490 [Enterococcus sp. 9D6_DIV0238]
MTDKYCCIQFEKFVTNSKNEFINTNKLIYHDERFDEYGIIIHDGGQSYITITHCPWTGEKLPESKKDQWFDELEKLGFEDPISEYEEIPEEYKSAKWMKSKNK